MLLAILFTTIALLTRSWFLGIVAIFFWYLAIKN